MHRHHVDVGSSPPERSGPSPGGVIALMGQLKQCQQALRETEARCEVLEDENRSLRRSLASQSKPSMLETVGSHSPAVGSSSSSSPLVDSSLIESLQRQLADLVRRNTQLEREAHDRERKERRRFQEHVERLELELRRVRTQQQGGGSSSLTPTPSQTILVHSRRNLL